jgi:hypothetical protein
VHLLVLAARVPRRHWCDSGFLADVLRALADRGHSAQLVADCVEDPAMFEGERVVVRALHPYENTAPRAPRALARTLRRRVDHGGYDAVLSTTALVPVGVLMPIEPNAMSWLNHASQALPPHSLALTLIRHHVAFGGAIAERITLRGARPGSGPGALRRVVALGARTAERMREAMPVLAPIVMDLGYAAAPPDIGQEGDDLRTRTRRALGIGAERPVVLVAQLAAGRWIRPLLSALGEIHRADPARCPVVLVAARDTFAIHALAARRGALEPLRLLGTTEQLGAALAAADALAVPMTRGRSVLGAEGSAWCARIVATALTRGRPVIAAADAPGAELVQASGAGAIVNSATAGDWRDALAAVLLPATLAGAGAKAAALGPSLRFDGFVDRLERLLADSGV